MGARPFGRVAAAEKGGVGRDAEDDVRSQLHAPDDVGAAAASVDGASAGAGAGGDGSVDRVAGLAATVGPGTERLHVHVQGSRGPATRRCHRQYAQGHAAAQQLQDGHRDERYYP